MCLLAVLQELVLGKLEHLQHEKNAFMAKINEARKKSANANDKKLRVCDVCGSFLSLYDSDKCDLVVHLQLGKLLTQSFCCLSGG